MGQDGWRRSDAWIFVAVVMANGAGRHMRSATTRRPEGVRLADVLSMADHLRQSLPDRREVEEAVRRLTGAGLITVGDGRSGWARSTACSRGCNAARYRSTPTGLSTTPTTRPRSSNTRAASNPPKTESAGQAGDQVVDQRGGPGRIVGERTETVVGRERRQGDDAGHHDGGAEGRAAR
jgi:hypothetical protein